jgi:ATP-dependent Clp protease adaptor protein ClpS
VETHAKQGRQKMAKKKGNTKKENSVQLKDRVQRPRKYKVIMHNDDFTPMEFVTGVLEQFFNHSPASATRVMLSIHKDGIGVAGIYSREIAETKKERVLQISRENGFPLLVTTEAE